MDGQIREASAGGYRTMVFSGLLLAGLLFVVPHHALAQNSAPYDSRLHRLAEVLGSVHYLRNLCGETSNQWREQMEQMLAVEKPDPNRRARLIASFNKGYRTFDSVYTACTPQAVVAVNRYMSEGEELAVEINSRYAE